MLPVRLAQIWTALGLALAVHASQGSSAPTLLDVTLEQLVFGLERGDFTSVDLVTAYTNRIAEVNSTLRMVTEINPDALNIAAMADTARASGDIKGPLHGIPILIKNNIATDDKMANTAGSYALLGAEVTGDSTVAAKLRDAGAVILGKASMSEWANYRSTNGTNGWSALGGQTEGAYHLHHDPSGSSSGSGVAASLGLSWAAIGTETDGSIVSPSERNNIVGIKPTVGLTSRHLVIPISEHQDTVGPMARTVKDAAYLLKAIAGQDLQDNYTSAIPFGKTPDYIGACDYFALRGKRIGVPRNMFDIKGNEDRYGPIVAAFDASLDVFRKAGATVVDNLHLEGYDILASAGYQSEKVVLGSDFVTNLKSYLRNLKTNPNGVADLASLQDFVHNQVPQQEEYPARNTEAWQKALDLGFGNDSPHTWSNYTQNHYLAGLLGITGALHNHSLDALVMPTSWSSSLPAMIGSPIITVPLGAYPLDHGVFHNQLGNLVDDGPNIPFGIAFMGAHFDEEALIGLAYAFEQRTMVRDKIRPYMRPKTEIFDVVPQTAPQGALESFFTWTSDILKF